MSRLDIDALRTLCAITDHGGVTRASEHLALSQSAVSHKIKRLEAGLDCALLSRRPGAPLLTEDGARLLQYARRILSLHDEALQSLSKRPLSGKIRLGMTEDVTSSELSRILGRFARLHPKISVRTHVKQSLVLAGELDRGEIDLAMMQVFEEDMRPEDVLLFQTRLHWVKSREFSLDKSCSLPFLSYDTDCFYKNWGMDAVPGLSTVLECASSAGIKSAVQAGLGIALLPATYLTPEIEIIDAEFPRPPTLAYILRGGKARSVPVQTLIQEIVQNRRTGYAAAKIG
ncbi:LysR family transcriptional regulator [Halocynthiibacter namhaensis]|uniref:LysR family transcriptional regulator n=1 Tax=Halocynthiibacter namhaensis TaxID=1290553 RepID=UPI0005798654|nr:LysR family transcriptional regulator [Halocynthiibacter namhaensis]